MPQDRVPSATALCINRSNVDLITKGNLSHYQMISQVESKFREWSPATFMGFNNCLFDDEIMRREFFKSLRKPYLMNIFMEQVDCIYVLPFIQMLACIQCINGVKQ